MFSPINSEMTESRVHSRRRQPGEPGSTITNFLVTAFEVLRKETKDAADSLCHLP